MPLQRTARFKLAEGWLRGEDFWGDPVTQNFIVQDALLHGVLISMTQPAPPILNAEGDMYVVPVGGTGVFADHDGEIAYLDGQLGWLFIAPIYGIRLRCRNPDAWYWYTGPEFGWREESFTPNAPAIPGTRYDVAISVGFEALPEDVLVAFACPEAMVLPLNAPGSVGRAVDWPGAEVVMAINRNNAPVGTIRWVPGLLTAQIDVATDQVFALGDLLTVVMPATLPDGFRNYGITLRLLLVANGG